MERRTLTVDEVTTRLLPALKTHRLYAAFLVFFTTGLRCGEVAGLRWQDIDGQAAVLAVRQQGPAGIVVAAPVGSRQACEALTEVADQVICPLTPEPFSAVGLWYVDFSQTGDDEVRHLISAHRSETPVTRSA